MPNGKLLQAFKTSERGVLLGVASFWEGVDVPGDALQLVVMDKLPFTPHDHPVKKARDAKLKDDGKDPFSHSAVPEAIINMKQGHGRLIRSVTDSGIVAVLDSRMISTPFGGRMVKALPKSLKASKFSGVESFYRGIAA